MSRLTTPRNGSDMRTPQLGQLPRASRAGSGGSSPVMGDVATHAGRRGRLAWLPCSPPTRAAGLAGSLQGVTVDASDDPIADTERKDPDGEGDGASGRSGRASRRTPV